MKTDDLDFNLPPHMIAQAPAARRDESRLLHYRRSDGQVAHRRITDLPRVLAAGDLLVFNDTRVLPSRFLLEKETGGAVEGLFLSELAPGEWRVLLKNAGGGPWRALCFAAEPALAASIIEQLPGGEYRLKLSGPVESAAAILGRVGRMPLPPYIKRDKSHDARDELDRDRYQTVFARAPGAVAAPTAALHFSQDLLAALNAAGVERAFVTLHVGMGTFKPVTADRLADHPMHEEAYVITDAAASAINRAREQGRRIIAVGTTSARVLESQPPGPIAAGEGGTSIFIYPPYVWRRVDALLTNFHLPRSTLIALVAAMVGLDVQRQLYTLAIEHEYRFFSYGDAMLIE